jgi:branched-subunit amino acid aminotransferase/4-amino-4-deoxychorismate lyase
MLLYNGQLLPEDGFALPLPNRGLFFNDGFFETLVWAEGGIRYLPHHAARMQQAAAVLGLELPVTLASPENLTNTLKQLLAPKNQQPTTNNYHRLRLQLWRDGGGLYAPATSAVSWLATARPFEVNDSAIRTADFAHTVRAHLSPGSFCKGPHSLTYVLAARERQQRGLEELLLLDAAGHGAEGVAAAVFWISGGQLFTPRLETGCVAGVRRAHLLHVARQRGIPTHEVFAGPEVLAAAEAVFTANVAGIRAVRRLGAVELAPDHDLLAQLRHWEAMNWRP